MTDPIADCLTRIRNAYLAKKERLLVPYSKLKEALLLLFQKYGYIGEVTRTGSMLTVQLIYHQDEFGHHKEPAVSGIKRISKPGLRIYVGRDEIPTVLGGMGISVISTPQGLLADKEARRRGLGGELICSIW